MSIPLAALPAGLTGNDLINALNDRLRRIAGATGFTWATAPATHTATGVAGQIAYDAAGNLYWCYAANAWARSGPGGYSNSF